MIENKYLKPPPTDDQVTAFLNKSEIASNIYILVIFAVTFLTSVWAFNYGEIPNLQKNEKGWWKNSPDKYSLDTPEKILVLKAFKDRCTAYEIIKKETIQGGNLNKLTSEYLSKAKAHDGAKSSCAQYWAKFNPSQH